MRVAYQLEELHVAVEHYLPLKPLANVDRPYPSGLAPVHVANSVEHGVNASGVSHDERSREASSAR